MSDLDAALDALEGGRAVVIPTDTVYGIAASPRTATKLFDLKGRPRMKALPVLASDLDVLRGVVLVDERAERLARRYWPGPLTIVLPRAHGFEADLGGDGSTIAVRVPDHPIALALLRRSGPLAVTSANRSGEPPLTTPDEATALFGEDVVVLDGGRCDGATSTIVDLAGPPSVVRTGALPGEEVLQALMS